MKFSFTPVLACCLSTLFLPVSLRAGLEGTFIALPDTQKYLDTAYTYEPTETTPPVLPSYAGNFAAQTQWIVDNANARNISFTSHLGDVVEHGGGSGGNPLTKPGIIAAGFFRPNGNSVEWGEANRAMNTLNGRVPYSVLPGNHDYDFVNADQSLGILAQTRGPADRSATQYLARFGPHRFAAATYQGGAPSATNFFLGASANGLNTAQIFTQGSRQFIHLSLEWEAPDSALAFAQAMVDSHPGVPAILSTHSYIWDQPGEEGRFGGMLSQTAQPTVTFPYPIVRTDGSFSQTAAGNNGEEIWNEFVAKNASVVAVLNGHWSQPSGEGAPNQNIGEWAQVSLNNAGLPVYEMLSDYQDDANGGDGWMRMLEFRTGQASDGGDVLLVRTYSPVLDLADDGMQNFSEGAFKPNDSEAWQNGLGLGYGDVDDSTVFPLGLNFDPRDSQFYYVLNFDERFAAVPEPGTIGLLAAAGFALIAMNRRWTR